MTLENLFAATIALIPDNVSRTVYAQSSSSILGVDEQLIFTSIEQSRSGNHAKITSEPMQVVFSKPKTATKQNELSIDLEESTLIRLLVIYGETLLNFEYEDEQGEPQATQISTAEYIITQLSEDDILFTQPVFNKIYSEFIAAFQERETILNAQHFVRHQDIELSQSMSELLSDKHQISDWSKKEIFVPTETDKLKDLVVEGVIRLKSKQVKLKLNIMLKQLKNNEIEEHDRVNFLANFQQLNQLSIHIDKELGREC